MTSRLFPGSRSSRRSQRRVHLGLDTLEGRQMLSATHPLVISNHHEVGVAIAGHSASIKDEAVKAPIATHHAAASDAKAVAASTVKAAAASPAPAPVPIALLPYEKVTFENQVQAPGQPYYSSFQMFGSSPDWGASGILDYFSYTAGKTTTYYYSIYTQDRGGTWSKLISSDAPYYAPNAPTSLVHSSPHYSFLYANPETTTNPQGPGSGSSSNTNITTFLPAPYNTITGGNLIPGTNYYSSFSMGGSNPTKGTSVILGYHTGNPYGVNQYYWSVYIHSPVLGNISYQEVDYSPYYASGLPPGVAAYLQQYKGYL